MWLANSGHIWCPPLGWHDHFVLVRGAAKTQSQTPELEPAIEVCLLCGWLSKTPTKDGLDCTSLAGLTMKLVREGVKQVRCVLVWEEELPGVNLSACTS